MSFRLTVRVNPGTSRRRAVWKGDFLKVNLTAPPEDGRANEELVDFLADLFGVDTTAVTLDRGGRSREKQILLSGLDRETLVRRLRSLTR